MSADFRLEKVKRLTSGDPDMVREWNKLVENQRRLEKALLARTLQPSPTTRIGRGPSGQRVNVLPTAKSGSQTLANLLASFRYDAAAEAWKLRVSYGVVRYQLIGEAAAPVGLLVPKLASTALGTDPAPEETLTFPGYIYCRVQTDEKGVPTGTPTITQSATEKSSTHHVPPSPDDSGTAGDYYFQLGRVIQDPDDASRPKWQTRLPGNLHIPNQLIEIDNIGGQRPIYKGYLDGADDKHEFRTLEAVGTGKPVLQPVPGAGEGETLKFRGLKTASPLNGIMTFEAGATDDDVQLESDGATGTIDLLAGGSIGLVAGIVESFMDPEPGRSIDITLSWRPAGGSETSLTMLFSEGILTNVLVDGVEHPLTALIFAMNDVDT